MLLGVPAGEIALLVAAVMVAGVATGILAGLFGIGGGAIIVPVLYEVFRILGVPEEVRMQLCVGTSMAIIIPTTIRSYVTHRAKGMVLNDVMRAWAMPAVARRRGGLGHRLFRAERGVQDRVHGDGDDHRHQASVRPRQLEDRRRFSRPAGDDRLWLSDRHHIVADGRERRLGLQHDPDALRQAAAQRGRDLFGPRRADHHRRHHRPGAWRAGRRWRCCRRSRSAMSRCSASSIMAPVSSFTAPYGALLAHRLSKRQLEIGFGVFLLLVSARFVASFI